LLDFGLARLRASADDDTLNTSMPGLILGTLAYMAPEQLLGQPVDHRADIFALGVIVIEVLTGERPFSADPLHRLRDIERGVAASIISNEHARTVLGRCVAIDPNDRYPTVDAARSELLAVVRLCAQGVRTPAPYPSEERTS
jgi:serine/threonine protein kinase